MGKYIYGIIKLKENESSPADGIYVVPYNDIAAVVRDSEVIDYEHMVKTVLAKLLLNHQQVIEKYMEHGYNIIPLKLGTFFAGEKQVRSALKKGYLLIKEILAKMEGKVEIDVAATWTNFSGVIKEAGEEEAILKAKKELLADPAKITIEDQTRIGMMIKGQIDRQRESCAVVIREALSKASEDFRSHALMDDQMVVNLAFWVDRRQQKVFDEVIWLLNNNFGEKLNFRCVGPLPPYSFCTLLIKKMEFVEVEQAREILGLNDLAGSEEIKKAYCKKAAEAHPDKNPQGGTELEFCNITRAYNLIVDYLLACQQNGQINCSFKKSDFESNAFLVKVVE